MALPTYSRTVGPFSVRSVSKLYRWVVFVLSFVASSCFSESGCPTPAQLLTKWDLWSHGTCLRGANIWQKVIDPTVDGTTLGPGPVGPALEDSDFATLASWGANYVNFSVPGTYTETPPYVPNTDVVARLDSLIAAATKANLFVVLSFRTGPGRNEGTFNASTNTKVNNQVWRSRKIQQAWAEMWKYTAQRYRSYANVVGYDLMVEPNSNDVLLKIYDSRKFYPTYANSTYDWNPLAQRITQAIRAVDPNTPVLVGAMNYSDLDWLWALKPTGDSETIYTVHPYLPTSYTNQYPPLTVAYPGNILDDSGNPAVFDESWLQSTLQPFVDYRQTQNVTVAVNEFGVMRWETGADGYLTDMFSLFESMGINHAYWLWDTEYPIPFDEFNLRHGPDYNNHADVTTSAVIQAVKREWKLNSVRPNDVVLMR